MMTKVRLEFVINANHMPPGRIILNFSTPRSTDAKKHSITPIVKAPEESDVARQAKLKCSLYHNKNQKAQHPLLSQANNWLQEKYNLR